MKLTEQKITIAYVNNKITLQEALKVYREINLRKELELAEKTRSQTSLGCPKTK